MSKKRGPYKKRAVTVIPVPIQKILDEVALLCNGKSMSIAKLDALFREYEQGKNQSHDEQPNNEQSS